MPLILNIETSTNVCSVALCDDGEIISKRENNEGKSHASLLTVFIDEILKEVSVDIKKLDAIAVSKGPGSYTGLRIGVSVAKGLCYGADLKLISINTLQGMASGAILKYPELEENTLLCPMIDARRMEVYSALFDSKGGFAREVKAEIIDENSFSEELDKQNILFFGDGSEKITNIIKHPNAKFIADFAPSAEYMTELSEKAFSENKFEDVAYFEPFYLKDFVATVPKKNIFK